jgi:hypothetical protein
MRLNVRAFALTGGVVWGAAVLFATWWLVAFGFHGQIMQQLDHFYFGYSVSWFGAVIGGIWGFCDGFIGGWIFAWLYNKLAGG